MIRATDSSDEYERQKMELERDIRNVGDITEACDEAEVMFRAASDRLAKELP